MSIAADPSAEREKRFVALSSVGAAVLLTAMKLVVGILTNSIGILSEAAHSGLDLFAALVTYLAVRVSDRPPDREHPYGHGKVENLSALVETILLVGTCGWIVYESVHRLFEPVDVDVSIWSFVVMAISIAIDFTRSRALSRVARKHSSQALEADALHFSTDIWSSAVVIAGLAGVVSAEWFKRSGREGADWLYRADAVAALGVAMIVLFVSYRLGRRSVDVLIDRASVDVMEKVEEAVRRIPGISGVKRVRVRRSGAAIFVDMTLDIPRSVSLEEAHRLATEAERTVQELYPRTDVMVHIDPIVADEGSLVEKVWSAAARRGLGVHGVQAYDVRGRLSLAMHIEVEEGMTIGEAHERVTSFESDLRGEIPGLADIVTHIEPIGDRESRRPAVRAGDDDLRKAVAGLPRRVPGVTDCHNIKILREGGRLSVTFHCLVDPGLSISEAHALTVKMEAVLREDFTDLGRVVIHVEPPEARDR
jgi:cation diffusion facilitator family transporter